MNPSRFILTQILLTPLVGAAVLACLPEREGKKLHHWIALVFTLLTLVFTLHLPFNYAYADHTLNAFQFD